MTHELFEPIWVEQGFGSGLQEFQQLERRRIRDILLVSSLFDFYLFEEEGLLYEQIQSEYHGLQLSHTPEFTRVSSGAEALTLLRSGQRFDLIVTTMHIEDVTPLRLARGIRESGITTPIVLLAYDNRELNELVTHHGTSDFNRVFVWQGDFRLLIAIIKNLEDELNVQQDTSRFGVQCIMLVEDSIRYSSYFLPLLYSEVIQHSQHLISEGVNAAHRSLRMRARPKILLCSTWEEAMATFHEYEQHIIGVISDVSFPRRGEIDSHAGFELARKVKSRFFDVPVLLQSTDASSEQEAFDAGALFIAKNSPTFVDDFRLILRDHFAFGDFVFRTPEGREVGRATDLRSLEAQLQVVPDESLLYHALRNDFSNWLKARTEFALAFRLRPRTVSDYGSASEMRADVIRQLHEHRSFRQRGLLTEFSKDAFDPASSFARTGGGSVGGKARGLAFLNALLSSYNVRNRMEGLEIEVPPALVVCTDVFDWFVAENELQPLASGTATDEEIHDRFVSASRFPAETVEDLAALLEVCRRPLAVRSSSLLEDSQFQPFAGVYRTYMIPNSDPDPSVRLAQLLTAIKRVYASTFYRTAREYIKLTSFVSEDEKMAVIIQEMVGARHGTRYYPDLSGVVRSYDFYPAGQQKPEEGTVALALGLGKTIVDGGTAVRFCPRYPEQLRTSPADIRGHTQRSFYALDTTDGAASSNAIADERVVACDVSEAEQDGTLAPLASTWCADDNAIYDGISREGQRIVTFAPLLRDSGIALPKAIDFLAGVGSWAIGSPVEIEFAVTLAVPHGARRKVGLLQMRPLLLNREVDELRIDDIAAEELLCHSTQVLGNGVVRDVCDLVVVDADTFDRSKSSQAADEIAQINSRLVEERRSYILIGPGRWGSLDPLLGIPVKWDQICGARAIVEAGFRDMSVDPSQGSHFFQNLTAFQVPYFTVSARLQRSFVDWEWLSKQASTAGGALVRHLRLDRPVTAKIRGHERRGVILKPE